MDRITPQQFTALFTELCAAYDKQINELTALIYFRFVKDYSQEHVRDVVYGWIGNEDYFPRINRLLAELREKNKYKPYNPKQIGDGDFVPAPESIKKVIVGLRSKLN